MREQGGLCVTSFAGGGGGGGGNVYVGGRYKQGLAVKKLVLRRRFRMKMVMIGKVVLKLAGWSWPSQGLCIITRMTMTHGLCLD